MNKWIKFLKDVKDHKAGEIVELEAAKALALIEAGIAEEAEEPEEVKSKTQELTGALADLVTQQVQEGFEQLRTELKSAASRKPHIVVGADNEDADPTAGFKHFGEFAGAVRKHVVNHTTDERLKRISAKAPTNYAAEAIGADGGFLVPQQQADMLLKHLLGEESLLPRTRQIRTNANSITIPKDETTPWGSDGVQVYWVGEGQQIPDSKPKIGEIELKLHKLTALVPVTNELLEDTGAVSLDSYLSETVPEKITDKVNGAIIAGSGAGQPLGVLKSGALVAVAKEGSQTADTVVTANVLKMYATLPRNSKRNAIWLHHSTVFPQLGSLTIGQQPMFIPPGGVGAGPGGSLLGGPLIQSEDCEVLGDQGDLYALDLRHYVTVTKTTGIQTAMSLHLYFDRDMTAFRFVFRVAGQPWMKAPITQKKGGGHLSPFVTLAARA